MTFQSLLPDSSGLFERALEDVFGRSIEAIEPERIKIFWDPDRVPVEHMSVLAHALSVDLWDEAWDELKKRSVLRRWVELEFSKGTLAGYSDFIDIAGGRLVEYVAPPGGIFAAPDLTKAQWDAWTDQQPRVVIKLAKLTGHWVPPLDTIADQTFADADFIGLDDGAVLRARHAVLRRSRGAPDEELQLLQISKVDDARTATVTERLILPAEDPITTIAGDGFAGDGFVGAVDTGERSYSYSLDRTYVHSQSSLWLDTVPAGFLPRDTRYYRVSDVGDAGADLFADDSGSDDCFATPDEADELLGDVLYLHDPAIAAPMVDGNSFADASRVDARRYQAEFRIDLDSVAAPDDALSDVSYADQGFAMPEDLSGRESVYRAINAAKAERDRVLVTFQSRRRRTLGDGFQLGSGALIGGHIASSL